MTIDTNTPQIYNLIYFKLIELKRLLKQKLEECDVDWEECISDSIINQTDFTENQISFTQLIECLPYINYAGTSIDASNYSGYSPQAIYSLNENSNDYYKKKYIHEKDYVLIDKIYYYMSFLRWFLQQTNISQTQINEAKTLKELILLLDNVKIYENTYLILNDLDENDEIQVYIDKKNMIDFTLMSEKRNKEIKVPLSTITCTCNNNNINTYVIDAASMNWTVRDQSYQIQDGQEYWIYDFYLEADEPITDEQFYNIQCSHSFLNVNFEREPTEKKSIHIYSTPYNYPRLNQTDQFIVQLPKKVVQGKTYDTVRVTYQWGEYELTYPNGESKTGVFVEPTLNTQLLQEIECEISFIGYEQYKPATETFNIIVHENPYIMTTKVMNNNSTSPYYEEETQGYKNDEWKIDVTLKNYKNQAIIGETVYLKIEDETPFASITTNNNGEASYTGTIPYVNADFIDYNSDHPDAIELYITNNNIDFTQSKKLYYGEYNPNYDDTQPSLFFTFDENNHVIVEGIEEDNDNRYMLMSNDSVNINVNTDTLSKTKTTSTTIFNNDVDIFDDDRMSLIGTLSFVDRELYLNYHQIITEEPLTQNEIETETINNKTIYYFKPLNTNYKYKINFTSKHFDTGETGSIEYSDKQSLILTAYTDTDPKYDTSIEQEINLYYEPFIVRLDATNPYTDEAISDIYAGADMTLTLTFCDPLTQEPLQEGIYYTNCSIYNNWDNSSVSSNIIQNPITFEDYTVSDTPTSSAQLTIDIYTDQNNYERFFYNFEIKNHLVFPNKNTYVEGDIPEIFCKPFGEVAQENGLTLTLAYHNQAYRVIYPTGIDSNTGLIDLSQFRHIANPYNFDTSQFSIGEHTLDFTMVIPGYIYSHEIYTFTVVERPVPTSLYLASNKSHINAFNTETCNVYATVLDQNDDPISDIPVTISLINESDPPTLYTDENGIATRTYTSKGDGDLQFSAEITSDPNNFIPNTLVSEICMVEDYYEIKKNTTMRLKSVSSYQRSVSVTDYNFTKFDNTNDNDVSFKFTSREDRSVGNGYYVYYINVTSNSDSYYYGKGILTITYKRGKPVSGGGSGYEIITAEASFYVNVINPDNYDGLTLNSDKAILSYYDDENTILTAQLMNGINPVNQSNIAVKFYNGDTLLNTTYTNSNGIATTTYNSTGEGDVTITAKINYHPPSDFVIMEDCLYYDSGQNEKIDNYSTLNANYLIHNNDYYTLNRTLGESPASTYYTSVYLDDFTLPNTYEISVDISTDLVSQEMLSIASSPLQTYQGTNEFGIISTANQYGLYNRTNGTFIPYTTSGKLDINIFYNFNIIVDQTKIQTRIIDIDGGYVKYENSSTINQATNFHKFAIVNGGKAHNIKFKNLKVKKVKTITLSTDKTVLSYDDADNAILTVTHSEGAGQTIKLYNISNDSLIGTMTDNNDGTYTYNYESQGIGDTIIYAKSENIYSNLITIEDCLKYYPNTYNTTVNTDYTFPTNYQIEFTIFSNNTTSSSNTAFLRFDTSTGGYVGKGSSANRQIGIGTTYLSSTVPVSTDTTYRFEKENNTLYLTDGTNYITTSTTTYYTKLYYIQGSTNGQIKNIKIKPL